MNEVKRITLTCPHADCGHEYSFPLSLYEQLPITRMAGDAGQVTLRIIQCEKGCGKSFYSPVIAGNAADGVEAVISTHGAAGGAASSESTD